VKACDQEIGGTAGGPDNCVETLLETKVGKSALIHGEDAVIALLSKLDGQT